MRPPFLNPNSSVSKRHRVVQPGLMDGRRPSTRSWVSSSVDGHVGIANSKACCRSAILAVSVVSLGIQLITGFDGGS